MIKLDIATRSYQADDKIQEYVREKIGGLDKYLPRQARANTHAQIWLEEDTSGREDNRFVCEVMMTVDGTQLVSREGTLNMYAAIDIVEAKMKSQVRTLKDKQTDQHRRPRIFSRLLHRKAVAEDNAPEASAAESGL